MALRHFLTKLKSNGIYLLIIFCVGLLIYSHVLHAPFFYDDHELLLGNPFLKNIPALFHHWNSLGRKALTFLTFALNYHVNKENPFGYHLVNVFLHILTAWALYGSVLLLFRTPVLSATSLFHERRIFSFFVAMIFLTHPLQTQAVTYIWQRSEVLSGLLYLSSYALYLRGRLSRYKFYFILAAGVFILGLYAKGVIVSLPLLVVLTEIGFFNPGKAKRIFLRIWPFLILLLGSLVIWFKETLLVLEKTPLGFLIPAQGQICVEYFYTQFNVMLRYLWLTLIPIYQNVDYSVALVQSFFNIITVLSCLMVLVILGAALHLFRKHRLMAFGIFLFFIYLLPTSTIVKRDPMWEHRLYLSIAGFGIFLVALFFQIIKNEKIRKGIFISIICVLSFLTVTRNFLWRSPALLLRDTIIKSPLNARPYVFLGAFYLKQGRRLPKAFDLFKQAIKLNPSYHVAYNDLGLIYAQAQEWRMAEKFFKKAMQLAGHDPRPFFNMATLKVYTGDFHAARELLKESVRRKPMEKAYLSLGSLETLYGNMNQAREAFENALKINPQSPKAYLELGNMYFAQNDYDKALDMYTQALRLDPLFCDAYVNKGVVYYKRGDLEQARFYLEKALNLNSQRADIYKNLANVYYALGEYKKAEEFYQKSKAFFSPYIRYP